MVLSSTILPIFLLCSVAAAVAPFLNSYNARPRVPYVDEPDENVSVIHVSSQKQISSYKETYYFDQLIDHTNPKLGTFRQRYWHSYEFYEPGGPIVLSTPGETDAEGFSGYLTNATINGMIAQELNGATIVLEHRFFGKSNPAKDLSVDSLRLHTIQQAIEDFEYFARNVKLPQPNGDQVAPGKAPWILVGGSYSGALVNHIMQNKPGLFFAGYASSAVVQAIGHFSGYFVPIREHMPQNCSSDVQTVIAQIDNVLEGKNPAAIWSIKQNFGLGDIVHDDDFASALKLIFNYWQESSITSRSDGFYEFCDALEVKDGVSAPEGGWGHDHALQAWGKYWNSTLYERTCGSSRPHDCFNTWNPNATEYNNVGTPNADRSWKWMTCNEFGFFMVGSSKPNSIVSQALTAQTNERDCMYDFPNAFQMLKQYSIMNALGVNSKYGGWNSTAERLIFANGKRDPWREATVAVNGAMPSWNDDLQPHLLSDGFHCSDMLRSQGVSTEVHAVQTKALDYMKKWFKDWKPSA